MCMLVGYKHSCAPVPKKACWAFVFSACSPSMLRTRDKRREGDRAESEGPGKSGQRFLRSEVPRSVEGRSENGGDWGRTGQGWGRNEAGTLRRRAKPVVSQHLSSGAGYALADVSLRRLYILRLHCNPHCVGSTAISGLLRFLLALTKRHSRLLLTFSLAFYNLPAYAHSRFPSSRPTIAIFFFQKNLLRANPSKHGTVPTNPAPV